MESSPHSRDPLSGFKGAASWQREESKRQGRRRRGAEREGKLQMMTPDHMFTHGSLRFTFITIHNIIWRDFYLKHKTSWIHKKLKKIRHSRTVPTDEQDESIEERAWDRVTKNRQFTSLQLLRQIFHLYTTLSIYSSIWPHIIISLYAGDTLSRNWYQNFHEKFQYLAPKTTLRPITLHDSCRVPDSFCPGIELCSVVCNKLVLEKN